MATKNFESVDIKDLLSTDTDNYQKLLNKIKEMKFDDASFVANRKAEIEGIKKILAEKKSRKDQVLDQELQLLLVQLNKELSDSNETLYKTNITLDKINSVFQESIKQEDVAYQAKVEKVSKELAELIQEEESRPLPLIAGLEEKLVIVENQLEQSREKIDLQYNQDEKVYQTAVKQLHESYFSNLRKEEDSYREKVSLSKKKVEEIIRLEKELAKLDQTFEKSKSGYTHKILVASKEQVGALKKEFAAKSREYDNTRKEFNDKISSIRKGVDNELKSLEANHVRFAGELRDRLMEDLNDQEHQLRSALLKKQHNLELAIEKRRIESEKIQLEMKQIREVSKNKIIRYQHEHQIRLMSIDKEHLLALAAYEKEKNKGTLDCNKIKASQSCFRAVCKAKLDHNKQIVKLRNEFKLKNAEVEEIKIIQTHYNDIDVNKINVNYDKIKEHYLITNYFYNPSYRAVESKNNNLQELLTSTKEAKKILTAKYKEMNSYLERVIDFKNMENEELLASLTNLHDIEIKQLNVVLELVKEAKNEELETLTVNNINTLEQLHQRKLSAIYDNNNNLQKSYQELQETLWKKVEREMQEFDNFANMVGQKMIDTTKNVQNIAENQELAYNNYLADFAKCLNIKIDKTVNFNTAEIEKISLSASENDKLLADSVAILEKRFNDVVLNLEKERDSEIMQIDNDLKNHESLEKNKVNNIIKSKESEIAQVEKTIALNNDIARKESANFDRIIKAIDELWKKQQENQQKLLMENVNKSEKLKGKTKKEKRNNCSVTKAEDKWWLLKEKK